VSGSQDYVRGVKYDPFLHAEQLELQVLFRPLKSACELWLPDHDTIILRDGMRAVHQRAMLAHGLGHAVLGHRGDSQKNEMHAQHFAWDHLVDWDELMRVLQWAGTDLATAAKELNVTVGLLKEWVPIAMRQHRLIA
jgi:Zn-dependent peptidase ImmA (M78 family)